MRHIGGRAQDTERRGSGVLSGGGDVGQMKVLLTGHQRRVSWSRQSHDIMERVHSAELVAHTCQNLKSSR